MNLSNRDVLHKIQSLQSVIGPFLDAYLVVASKMVDLVDRQYTGRYLGLYTVCHSMNTLYLIVSEVLAHPFYFCI